MTDKLQPVTKNTKVHLDSIDLTPGHAITVEVYFSSYTVTERHLATITLENRGPVNRLGCKVVMKCNGIDIPLRGVSHFGNWQKEWAESRPHRDYGPRNFDDELEEQ